MSRFRRGKEWDVVVEAYARLGVQQWLLKEKRVRSAAVQTLATEVADNSTAATKAVRSPFRHGSDRRLVLIPAPCVGRKHGLAFFAPIDAGNTVAFDLALVVNEQRHAIAFRFEPPDVGEDHAHGYDHVQLSVSLGHRTAPLGTTARWLPDSYPAFPIAARDMRDRFLAMAVAMHGFPLGVKRVLDRIGQGESGLVRDCYRRVNDLVRRPITQTSA